MCFFFPHCLWMLADATIGIEQHSHTHTLSLSVSPLPCFLSPSFLTLYKPALRLCVYQLKYRFHRIWLFSFPKVTLKINKFRRMLFSFVRAAYTKIYRNVFAQMNKRFCFCQVFMVVKSFYPIQGVSRRGHTPRAQCYKTFFP